MKRSLLCFFVATLMATSANAAIIQTHEGLWVDGAITIIDTHNDTGDWIDDYGDADDSGTLYYGFDLTVNNTGDETTGGGFYTALQLFSDTDERFGVGNNWPSINYSTFGFGGDNDLDGTPYVAGEAARLVVQIDFVANGDDTATVWVNPTSEASTSTALGPADTAFNRIRLRTGNYDGSATYGNIVFATTFAEAAVPEPSSLLMLGIAAMLGCASIRRRK